MFLSLPRHYKIGILSMLIILVFSFITFYFFQTITENNIKDSLLKEQFDKQLVESKSVSQHIGADLTLVMTVLDGLTNSVNFQEGHLYGAETKGLMREKYGIIQDIVDKVFVLDQNDVVTQGLSKSGTEYVGADFSQRELVSSVRNDSKQIF